MSIQCRRRLSMLCLFLLLAASAVADGAAISLRKIEPNTGPVSGGTKIILFGSGFDPSEPESVKVLIGGQPSDKVAVHSESTITAVVPAGTAAGAVDVEVQYGGTEAATLKKAFCYDDGSSGLARWYRLKARIGAAWELLTQGGVVMLILGVLSVFALGWVIHCALVIRSSEIMPKPFLDKLSGHLSRMEFQPALEACQQNETVLGRVAASALRKVGQPAHKVREVAQAAGSREASHLFQKISYLSNVGVISPMLGLLGTVIGMTMAFKTFGMDEPFAKHILLAEAIYKALITTVAGLMVGIPAMAFFYYFRGRLLRILTDMEQVTEDVADAVATAGERE